MAATHLECSLTGERYPAGELHNLSRAGKPLLVRYDLGRGLVAREETVVLFNCANGNKYPLPDASRRLKLEGAEPAKL